MIIHISHTFKAHLPGLLKLRGHERCSPLMKSGREHRIHSTEIMSWNEVSLLNIIITQKEIIRICSLQLMYRFNYKS